jgi:predicted lipoprotein with Yx(FWY)xxD motif
MSNRGRRTGSILLGAGLVAAALAAPSLAAGHAPAKAKRTEIASVKTNLGRVVANSKGRVMFRFMKDGHTSTCGKSCQSIWPPVTSKHKPAAGTHIKTTKLDRTAAGQVTYYGHPLYYYTGDPKPGKTTGNGTKQFGDHWYVVSTTGKPVKHKPGGGGGGYKPVVPDSAPTINAQTEGMTTADPVLATASGRAVYGLASETASQLICTDTGHCIPVWKPVLTDAADDAAVAGPSVTQAMLGTFDRTFGTTTVHQVSYNGHPLYTYQGDTAANQDNGQWQNTAGHFWGTVFPSGGLNQAVQP